MRALSPSPIDAAQQNGPLSPSPRTTPSCTPLPFFQTVTLIEIDAVPKPVSRLHRFCPSRASRRKTPANFD